MGDFHLICEGHVMTEQMKIRRTGRVIMYEARNKEFGTIVMEETYGKTTFLTAIRVSQKTQHGMIWTWVYLRRLV